MKLPLSWLKEYLDLPFTPEKIAETLTLAGIEVDEIQSIGGSFSGVVIGKVVSTAPHPNADRLKVAQVFDGVETVQVVCGASNCREGLFTAFAKLGATLQEPDGKSWKIKKSKIRDVESFGMLCAKEELGLEKSSEGILELPADSTPGTDLSSLYKDTIFTLSLTPNLGHCMSVYGVARELSAFFKIPLKSLPSFSTEKSSTPFIQAEIENSIDCPRYSCTLIEDLKVGPSPDWLAKKLELCGLKSINNVVDVSNYVLLLTGQPLHFFDYDLVEGKKITVSTCKEEEKLLTLDGLERTLPKNALVIRDAAKILAVAGIMGGSSSAVSDKTTKVLIESAIFRPGSIRKTSKTLGLKTDASMHFERGVDADGILRALNLAADLLTQVAEGKREPGILDVYPSPIPTKKTFCRRDRVNALLGITLSLGEISSLLERLEIKILSETPDSLEVEIPSYRNDLAEEIDLVEEVARLYGFNHIPKGATFHRSSSLLDAPIFTIENEARALLLNEGLQEFLTCDLISPFFADLTEEKNDKKTGRLTVLQSKSNDYSILRSSLLPGLLQLVKHNVAHQNRNISGFEVGRIHFSQKEEPKELTSIGIILSGASSPHHHDPKPRKVDFFDLKGIVENLLQGFNIQNISFETSHLHNFQPGRQARIQSNDICLGVIGEIHPNTMTRLDLQERIYFAELDLQELYALRPKGQKAKPLIKIPSSERDWTMTLTAETAVGDVLSCIESVASPFLESAFLLDLFEGEKVGLGRKNVTWRFIYRDKLKTIDYETVEKEHKNLVESVAKKLGNCIL
jgi:phenylalanyl-tRNA synthetase beta chain